MGKFFQRAGGGIGLAVTADDEARGIVPADAIATAAFDESVPANAVHVADYQANPSRYAFAGGVLQKDGVNVAFAPDSALKQEIDDLLNQAAGAVGTNNTYLALATPTAAQTAAQVKALSQQNNRIIRRLVRLNRLVG